MEECRLLADAIFIYLFLQPALNPMSYGRSWVLEAASRSMLVMGRSFYEETVVIGTGLIERAGAEGITED